VVPERAVTFYLDKVQHQHPCSSKALLERALEASQEVLRLDEMAYIEMEVKEVLLEMNRV
jgi:hypothetical protein